jgi:hypothetical protein
MGIDKMKIILCFFVFLITSIVYCENMGEIKSGETKTGSISNTNPLDSYYFSVSANQSGFIRISSEILLSISIIAPDGEEELIWNSYYVDEWKYEFKKVGTYRITIDSYYSGVNGTYKLALFLLPGEGPTTEDPDGGELVLNKENNGNLDTELDIDVFNFDVQAGHKGFIRLQSEIFLRIAMYAPDGSLEYSWNSYSVDEWKYEFKQVGTYTIVVGGYYGSTIGPYKIALFMLPGEGPTIDDPDGGELVLNKQTNGTFNPELDIDVFNFDVQTGYRGFIRIQSEILLRITIYAPDGSIENSWNSYYVDEWNYEFKQVGTYTIVVGGYYGSTIGPYKMALFMLPGEGPTIDDPDGGELVLNKTYTGNLNTELDIDVYDFHVRTGQKGFIKINSDILLKVSLYDPEGNMENSWNSYSIDESNFQFQKIGTYTIVVAGYYGNITGPYNIWVYLYPETTPTITATATITSTPTKTPTLNPTITSTPIPSATPAPKIEFNLNIEPVKTKYSSGDNLKIYLDVNTQSSGVTLDLYFAIYDTSTDRLFFAFRWDGSVLPAAEDITLPPNLHITHLLIYSLPIPSANPPVNHTANFVLGIFASEPNKYPEKFISNLAIAGFDVKM